LATVSREWLVVSLGFSGRTLAGIDRPVIAKLPQPEGLADTEARVVVLDPSGQQDARQCYLFENGSDRFLRRLTVRKPVDARQQEPSARQGRHLCDGAVLGVINDQLKEERVIKRDFSNLVLQAIAVPLARIPERRRTLKAAKAVAPQKRHIGDEAFRSIQPMLQKADKPLVSHFGKGTDDVALGHIRIQ